LPNGSRISSAMELALMGVAAIIALVALVAIGLRRARCQRAPLAADSPEEDRDGLRRDEWSGEHGELRAESDPLGSANAEARVAPDRLLDPPEWPDDFSVRRAQRARVG
jgi:hypothetical protein